MKFMNQRHPSRAELLDYASGLVGRRPLAASVGAHLTRCKKCNAEVSAMRGSLGFVAQAPALEPSAELTAGILAAARREMQVQPSRLKQFWNPRRSLALGAYAAATFVFAALSAAPVWLGLTTMGAASGEKVAVETTVLPEAVPGQSVEQNKFLSIASEVEVLANAVRASLTRPQSATERIRQCAVNALDAEIEAALAALERNPGCAKATQLVQANLERQAETLRAYYAERSL